MRRRESPPSIVFHYSNPVDLYYGYPSWRRRRRKRSRSPTTHNDIVHSNVCGSLLFLVVHHCLLNTTELCISIGSLLGWSISYLVSPFISSLAFTCGRKKLNNWAYKELQQTVFHDWITKLLVKQLYLITKCDTLSSLSASNILKLFEMPKQFQNHLKGTINLNSNQ